MTERAQNQGPKYDSAHRRLRAREAPRVAAGGVACARCGKPIEPDARWDLGHDDRDKTKYVGPEHERCNRATRAHQPPRKRPREPHPGLVPGVPPLKVADETPLA